MSINTIISNGTLTLGSILPTGTNIEFLNNFGNAGELFIAPAAIVATAAGGFLGFGASLVGASIGGVVENFRPGDTIDVQNIDQVYSNLNVNAANAADNALFDLAMTEAELHHGEIFIGPNGAVTDNFGYAIDSTTQLIFDDLRSAMFGTGANNATLTMTPEPTGFLNSGAPDGLFTTDSVINPCFAAGTRILTTRGEIAVENLVAGDRAITHAGEEREIIWIGHRQIDITRHPHPQAVQPIIIEAGAIADNCPARRLTLSPDHGLFIDDVLIQPKDLLNGASIRQNTAARHVHYFHVELDRHDILFAEGTPAESYLDTGHRGVFDNAEEPLILHPDLMQTHRETNSCAPLCLNGPTHYRIKTRLTQRAGLDVREAV